MIAALRHAFADGWTRLGALSLFLRPLSWLYGGVVRIRRQLYRQGVLKVQRAGVPVVVVGNVVAGGGGKTPLVIALVKHLQLNGLKAGVISRGYGRRHQECREVHHESTANEVGDEPLLIRVTTGVPVFVAAARIDAARSLVAKYSDIDVLICDDGLQHYGLHRDVEICVFDERGAGNGLLLPAGPLREPLPRPADLVLRACRMAPAGEFSVQRSLASHARRADGALVALKALCERGPIGFPALWAIAATAMPENFFSMLRAQGLELAGTTALADHAGFDPDTLASVNGYTLLCTEKDATKLWRHRPDALAVPLVLHLPTAFWRTFDAMLIERSGAKLSFAHGHTTA